MYFQHTKDLQIRSGDLLAWSSDRHPKNGFSRWIFDFIRLMTLSEYGHVGIAYVKDRQVYVLEAVRPSIRYIPLEEGTKCYVIQMKVKDPYRFFDLIPNYLHCPYSIFDCIRAYFGFTTKNDRQYQCAELVNEIYQILGHQLQPKRITPSGVVQAALEHSGSALWFYHNVKVIDETSSL